MRQVHHHSNDFITRLTSDFIGREWVFAEIDQWLGNPDTPRFFIITGEPGIGKSAIAARLTQTHDLAAYHFCIARQSDAIDPRNFTRLISRQLSTIDGFAKSILEDQGVQVEVNISVVENYGGIIGVQIENLIAEAKSGTVAFNHTVIDPLKRLYKGGFDQQLVFLIDALDEAIQHKGPETIVDLLANAQGLPRQVRWVLTSRPDDVVFRDFEHLQTPFLMLDAGRAENLKDIQAYALHQIETSESLQACLTEYDIRPSVFIEKLQAASKGNFLYMYLLLPAIANRTQLMNALDALPEGLDNVYREFLRTRTVGKDIHLWRSFYRPVLGVLAVAQAPLTAEQLEHFTGLDKQDVTDCLLDVRQFLDPQRYVADQYSLYHQSLVDFFFDKEKSREYWTDFSSYHQKIIDYYRKGENNWKNVDWNEIDDYGLQNLSKHHFELRHNPRFQFSFDELMCEPFMREKVQRYGSYYAFGDDLRLFLTIDQDINQPNLVRAFRGSLISSTLIYITSNTPINIIGVLCSIGQIEKAINITRLFQDPFHKCEGYIQIARGIIHNKEKASEMMKKCWDTSFFIVNEQNRVSIYSTMVDILLSLEDMSKWDSLLVICDHISEKPERMKLVGKLVCAFSKISDIEKVNLIFSKESTHTDSNLLSELAIAYSLLEEIQGINKVENIGKYVDDKHAQGTIFLGIARAYERVGQADRAYFYLEKSILAFEGIDHDKIFDMGKMRSENLIMAWMVDSGMKVGLNLLKIVEICKAVELLITLERSEEIDEIVGKLFQMLEIVEDEHTSSNFVGDFSAYDHLINLLVKLNKDKGAKNVYSKALTTADNLTNIYQKTKALISLTRSAEILDGFEEFLSIVKKIDSDEEKDDVLEKLTPFIAKSGNLELSLKETAKIKSDKKRVKALVKIAETLDAYKYYDEIIHIVEDVFNMVEKMSIDSSAKWSAFSQLSFGLVKAEKVDQSEHIANRIGNTYKKLETLIKISLKLDKQEHREVAKRLTHKVIEQIDCVDREILDRKSEILGLYSYLIEAILMWNETDYISLIKERAVLVANEIDGSQWRSYSIDGFLMTCAKSNNPDLSNWGVETLINYARSDLLDVRDNNVYSICNYAEALSSIEYNEKATEILEDCFAELLLYKNTRQEIIYEIYSPIVAKTHASIGNYERALELIDKTEMKRYRKEVLQEIIKSLSDQGLIERALELADGINDEKEKIAALKYPLTKLTISDDSERSLDIANKIVEELSRIELLIEILKNIDQINELEKGLPILEYIFFVVQDMMNGNNKDMLLAQISSYYAKLGSLNTAIGLLSKIADKYKREQATCEVVIAGSSKHANESLGLIEKIESPRNKALTQAKLAKRFDDDVRIKMLYEAFVLASNSGRDTLFSILADEANFLADIDNGQTLWGIYQVIQEVDSWWGGHLV
ncbi:hypothetical protein ACFLZW_02485 [Chloroflexota bacterium]